MAQGKVSYFVWGCYTSNFIGAAMESIQTPLFDQESEAPYQRGKGSRRDNRSK